MNNLRAFFYSHCRHSSIRQVVLSMNERPDELNESQHRSMEKETYFMYVCLSDLEKPVNRLKTTTITKTL